MTNRNKECRDRYMEDTEWEKRKSTDDKIKKEVEKGKKGLQKEIEEEIRKTQSKRSEK